MSTELLSVCIPTRNRARYLRDLLEGFAMQVKDGRLGPADVGFHVSDNASDDETAEVVKAFARQVPQTRYFRNPANIGGDENILHVRTYGQGQYIWDLGDDELLAENALVNLVRLLREQQPGLVIAYPPTYEGTLPKAQEFADYRAYARECLRINPHAMAFHSLISCNIYRADCYDMAFAEVQLQTHLAQLYGMMRPLLKKEASVVLPEFPIILMREVVAGGVDGGWSDLDKVWVTYFTWLRDEMQMPELDPHAPSEFARKALVNNLWRHPVRTFRKNWRAAFQPQAWRFAFNRVFRRARG